MSERKRIMMAMSGGVDSSLAAALLKEQGHELIGVTVRGWTPPGWEELFGEKSCCSLEASEDARAVASSLDIPFYVLNFADAFYDDVVQPFVDEYIQGRTPNPCTLCNRRIRFERLYRKARELECDAVATGHFARIVEAKGRYRLYRGLDRSKDQSYMLYTATQQDLAMTLYPLGEMTKPQVRDAAAKRALRTASRPESQDICFVPDGDYARLIRELRPEAARPGPILHIGGREIGHHQGLYEHTVGQRRGLGIAWPEPLYVVRLDAARNALIVAEKQHLFRGSFLVEGVHWIAEEPSQPLQAEVKIRYGAEPVAARLEPMGGAKVRVVLAQEQRAITPGQAAVFYRGDEVLGGGIIQ